VRKLRENVVTQSRRTLSADEEIGHAPSGKDCNRALPIDDVTVNGAVRTAHLDQTAPDLTKRKPGDHDPGVRVHAVGQAALPATHEAAASRGASAGSLGCDAAALVCRGGRTFQIDLGGHSETQSTRSIWTSTVTVWDAEPC